VPATQALGGFAPGRAQSDRSIIRECASEYPTLSAFAPTNRNLRVFRLFFLRAFPRDFP